MSNKHHGIVPKEILDQSKSYFEKQKQKTSVSQPQPSAQELQRESPQEFKPTPSFSRIFSETVGKKPRPGINLNLEKNPRLKIETDTNIPQSKGKGTDEAASFHDQESRRESSKKFEPSITFHTVFDDLMGKNRPDVKIRLKDNPRLTHERPR